MKPQHIFFLFLFISCQKPKPVSQIHAHKKISKNKTDAIVNKENFSKTDTVYDYTTDGETSKDNYILANLLDQKMDKDSVVTGKYRLDFYFNKVKTADTEITIKGIEKGSEWNVIYGLGRESINGSPFFQISFGYPACGYTHNNYLYYLKNSNLQLLHDWYTMSDSGWGSWVEFGNPDESNPESFYCKIVAFGPDDNDDNMGTLTYSDSIVFRLSGNHWEKQLLSAEDKPYFEKKMSFDDFHKE